MKVFTTTEFDGHWPVGVAAVVVAENETAAAELLNAELQSRGLGGAEAKSMVLVNTNQPQAIVLRDGDY